MGQFDLNYIAAQLLVLFLSIGIHEYAHCKVADLSGDPTPRYFGRVTLNLFKHFEPMGSIMILITTLTGFGIGWGRPAPVNPSKMKNPRWDHFASVAAGPISNLLQAGFWAIVFRLLAAIAPGVFEVSFVFWLVILGVFTNIGLALFNLIPFGVLDGHWLLGLLMPEPQRSQWFRFNQTVGFQIFIFLIIGDQILSSSTGFSIFDLILWQPTIAIASFLLGKPHTVVQMTMSEPSQNRRILSGMQATRPKLHLGNYEGALRPWVGLQEDGYEMYCMVADWHGLTTMFENPADISWNAREVAKDYIAAGIDPARSTVFLQSHVKEHAELHLLFSMITPLGWLERTPTYKEKQQDIGASEREPYGLLGYPVLQTADILLYRPYGVPVGRDQAPHLEIGNDIGRRFNSLYGVDLFDPYKYMIPTDEGKATLPGLDMRKMSKSYDNGINISDTEDETAAKIMSAFTTPTKIKKTDPGIPEGCAVCQFLKVYSPDWQTQWDEDRDGIRGCMQNKRELIEIMNEYFRPIRARRAEIDDIAIEEILKDGAERARSVAAETMDRVRSAMGLF